MRILGLDPGGTTGVCTYDSDPESPTFETFDLEGLHHQDLWDLLNDDPWDVVVYERFQYQRRELDKGVSLVLDSVEYIGIVKLFATIKMHTTHPVGLVEQTPAQGKNFWTNEKLEKVGLKRMTKSAHQRDALRHVLYYLTLSPAKDPELTAKLLQALR